MLVVRELVLGFGLLDTPINPAQKRLKWYSVLPYKLINNLV